MDTPCARLTEMWTPSGSRARLDPWPAHFATLLWFGILAESRNRLLQVDVSDDSMIVRINRGNVRRFL